MRKRENISQGDKLLFAVLQVLAVCLCVLIVVQITAALTGCTSAGEAVVPPTTIHVHPVPKTAGKVNNYVITEDGKLEESAVESDTAEEKVEEQRFEEEEEAHDPGCFDNYDECDEYDEYDDIAGC